MADIKPTQYIEYEKHCRKSYGSLTKLQQARVAYLKELDHKCKKCNLLPNDQLLCEGSRLVFSSTMSTGVALETCRKQMQVMDDRQYATRLKNTLISNVVATALIDLDSHRVNAHVEKKHDQLYFDGMVLPFATYDVNRRGLESMLKEYIIAMANCEFQGKYLYTVDFYRGWVASSSRVENIKNIQSPLLDCDWLVIEAIDFSTEASYFRDALFTVVRTRVAQMKHTTLLQSRNTPQWQSPAEREFFEEANKWQKFNLP